MKDLAEIEFKVNKIISDHFFEKHETNLGEVASRWRCYKPLTIISIIVMTLYCTRSVRCCAYQSAALSR